MRVAVVQFEASPEPVADRLIRLADHARAARSRGARLIVFPEMAVHGYTLERSAHTRAETLPGPSSRTLVSLAASLDAVLVAGLTVREDGDAYNTLLVVDGAGIVGTYRKMHVSSAETACWHDGGQPTVIRTAVGRIGLGICADMLWPTPWRHYRDGVDLVVIGAGWPDFRVTRPAPIGRALAFHTAAVQTMPEKISQALGVPTLFANACGGLSSAIPGTRARLTGRFAGGSRIVQGGRTVAAAEASREQVIVHSLVPDPAEPDGGHFDQPWIEPWSVRAQLCWLDKLTGWCVRPIYQARRRALRKR